MKRIFVLAISFCFFVVVSSAPTQFTAGSSPAPFAYSSVLEPDQNSPSFARAPIAQSPFAYATAAAASAAALSASNAELYPAFTSIDTGLQLDTNAPILNSASSTNAPRYIDSSTATSKYVFQEPSASGPGAPSYPHQARKTIDEILTIAEKNTNKYADQANGGVDGFVNRFVGPVVKFNQKWTSPPETQFEVWLSKNKLFGKFGIFMKRVFKTFFSVTPKQQWMKDMGSSSILRETLSRFFTGIQTKNL